MLFSGFGLVYMVLFFFIRKYLNTVWQSIFFGVIGFFLTVGAISFYLSPMVLDMQVFLSMNGVSLLFVVCAYFFAKEKSLHFLYPLGMLLGILILLPIWKITGEFAYYSILSIGILWMCSYVYVYFVPKILQNNPQFFILGNIL